MNYKLVLLISLILISIFSCVKPKDSASDVSFEIDVTLSNEEVLGGILTPEILWKFGRVGDIQLSPNGETILYCITYYSIEKNKGFTHIYSVPVQGGNPVALTSGEYSCFNPRWFPDGNKIAYISTQNEVPQIFTINTDGTSPVQVSQVETGVNSFEVSPNGEKVLFCSDVKLDKSPTDKYSDLPETNVIIATELMYRHWNSWHDYAYSHIFTANFKNNSLEEIIDIMKGERYDAPMSPYFDNSEMCWSPDNKYIAYTCKKYNGLEYATNTNSDIYLYELESGETKNISEGMLGYDKYPIFSNDMKHIAWQSMETPGYESDKDRLMVFDFESGTTENLTRDFDQNVSNLVWSNDDSSIYFISGYHAAFQLYQINTVSREITQITSGNHDYNAFVLGENNVLIGEKMSMQMASEIFKINPDGTENQITFTNQHIYDDIEMGAVEERWVTTTDGKQMLVWVIFPPAFDSTKEYPAILYCQGGPQSAVSQFWSYRWNFQIMAANGYIIVAPNRRGVPTFGQEWNAQISGDYGGQNMEDYLVAIDKLKQEPYIDEDRLGAIGASYGGFSVFWLAGHHNGRFKAFISHCGMFNLESQYAATEEMFFVNHDLGGAYWEKDNAIAQKSYENSPHRFVDKWDTPILIITGGNDFRIPYTESLQAFNAAQLNGVDSKLMVFPDESHFVLKPQNAILWQREFKSWLDTYLK